MTHPRLSLLGLVAAIVTVAATLVVSVSWAAASTASAQINAGTLALINGTPAGITFPVTTLGGADEAVAQTQAFDISDATGTAAGWNIQATSTTFTAAGHTLPTTATTIQAAPADATCDTGSSCAPAANTISYPYTLPAGATAPTATKMFSAAAGSGMGNQTITPIWTLTTPASTWAGGAGSPYTSTWTFTLVSGP